jgi:hypothetical protein
MNAMRLAWLISAIAVLGGVACGNTTDDDDGSGGTTAGGAAGSQPTAGAAIDGGAGNAAGASFGGSSPKGGAGGATASGAGGASSELCFSPIVNPELALDSDALGCECTFGEACVTVEDQGRPHGIALICEEGRWLSVEDGPCFPVPLPETSCKVFGRVYSSGSTYVPDPHSCNICSCEDGELLCTEKNCPNACPPNGAPGMQCAECGPTDACLIVEHTCLPVCSESEQCNGAACLSGMCRTVCG